MPVALPPPPPPTAFVQPVAARPVAALARVTLVPVSTDFARDVLEARGPTSAPTRAAASAAASAPTRAAASAATSPASAMPRTGATPLAVVAPVAPLGPLTLQEIGRSVESAEVGGVVVETQTLNSGSYGSVRALAGTRVTAGLHGSTVEVSASPGFVLDLRWGPNVEIQRIRYDIAQGEFTVDATGPGPDFIYRAVATHVANGNFRELLPANLARPDYDPRGDADVLEGVQHLVASLLTGQPGPGGIRLGSPTARATVRLDRELRMSLPDDMALTVPRGARFALDAAFEGPTEAPVLRDLSLRSSEGITIRKTTGAFASLAGLEIHSATLRPGGELSLDYQLLPERAINDGVSLLRLLVAGAGVASGDARGLDGLLAPAPDVRLDGARRQVEAMIDRDVEPALARSIREHAGAIPGVDLMRIAGLGPATDANAP